MTIKHLEMTEDALADNNGTQYVLLVDGIKRYNRREAGQYSNSTTVKFILERTDSNTGAPAMTLKDKRIRYSLGMSKQETVRAFEQMLDVIWAYDEMLDGAR